MNIGLGALGIMKRGATAVILQWLGEQRQPSKRDGGASWNGSRSSSGIEEKIKLKTLGTNTHKLPLALYC